MTPSRRALALPALLLAASPAQAQAPAPSAGARDLAQGGRDLAREERNRRLVLDFYEAVFVRHDLSVAERFLSEDYIQHNPRVPTGRAAFVAVFTRVLAANPSSRSRILRSATDGDLVFLHVHSRTSAEDRGRVIVDIFRVAGERIVEHWDVIQDIPETAANGNGML